METSDQRTYPYLDAYGYVWFDPSGFQQHVYINDTYCPVESPCFVCGKLTERVDIDYHGVFCNSEECNEKITRDLEMINEASWNEDSV